MGLQHVCEEMMVAIPLSPVIERHNEEVLAVERIDRRAAVLAS